MCFCDSTVFWCAKFTQVFLRNSTQGGPETPPWLTSFERYFTEPDVAASAQGGDAIHLRLHQGAGDRDPRTAGLHCVGFFQKSCLIWQHLSRTIRQSTLTTPLYSWIISNPNRIPHKTSGVLILKRSLRTRRRQARQRAFEVNTHNPCNWRSAERQ